MHGDVRTAVVSVQQRSGLLGSRAVPYISLTSFLGGRRLTEATVGGLGRGSDVPSKEFFIRKGLRRSFRQRGLCGGN
jgi:hypothetical protein